MGKKKAKQFPFCFKNITTNVSPKIYIFSMQKNKLKNLCGTNNMWKIFYRLHADSHFTKTQIYYHPCFQFTNYSIHIVIALVFASFRNSKLYTATTDRNRPLIHKTLSFTRSPLVHPFCLQNFR